MLFALAYYSALYSGVAAQVARSNTVARHFTQTPRCGNIEIYYVRTAVFINTEGKNGKRGACVRRACGRVSGSRNASGGRVQSMVVCVYTSAVPRMRCVVRNGCLRRTAPQALRGGSLCGFRRKRGCRLIFAVPPIARAAAPFFRRRHRRAYNPPRFTYGLCADCGYVYVPHSKRSICKVFLTL